MVFIIAVEVAAENPGRELFLRFDGFAVWLPRRVFAWRKPKTASPTVTCSPRSSLWVISWWAATSSEGPLPQDEIDRLLGVEAGHEVEGGDRVEAAEEPTLEPTVRPSA